MRNSHGLCTFFLLSFILEFISVRLSSSFFLKWETFLKLFAKLLIIRRFVITSNHHGKKQWQLRQHLTKNKDYYYYHSQKKRQEKPRITNKNSEHIKAYCIFGWFTPLRDVATALKLRTFRNEISHIYKTKKTRP